MSASGPSGPLVYCLLIFVSLDTDQARLFSKVNSGRHLRQFFSCSLLACDIGCTSELMLDMDKLGASLDNLPFNNILTYVSLVLF